MVCIATPPKPEAPPAEGRDIAVRIGDVNVLISTEDSGGGLTVHVAAVGSFVGSLLCEPNSSHASLAAGDKIYHLHRLPCGKVVLLIVDSQGHVVSRKEL